MSPDPVETPPTMRHGAPPATVPPFSSFGDGVSDAVDGDTLVGGVRAGLAVEPRHAELAALVVQRDHFPQARIEHRAAGAAALGGRAVMDTANVGDLRFAGGRTLMVQEFVVLAREGEVAPPGWPMT